MAGLRQQANMSTKGGEAEKGMIFLQYHHPIVKDALTELLGADAKREPLDIKASDFDDVEYHLTVSADDKDSVQLSMRMRCMKDIYPMGTKATLESVFGSALQDKPEDGYDVTLKWKVDDVKGDSAKLIKNASELKRICLSAPLMRCFEALAKGQSASLKPMVIKYREKETIYCVPSADRILVFFSIDMFGDTDRAIAANMLAEFPSEAKKVNSSPAVVFARDPMPQLKQVPGFKEDPSCVGYVYFTILKSHVDKPEKVENVGALLVQFRPYILYHVKAAKTYIQSRMRMRSELMLKILNRASPEAAEAEKSVGRRNTGTQQGKTFRKF